ncbi:unnamed protein product [Cylicocyclus nassatus]|uniref:Uncharacterized protein n=1 Tax=Cylicocyclus nassatus TaxID=53992 RepID=A0AA36HAJ9_CYLNA|nr:unnamed protein product [Cylicocyclus nassatus]
MLGARENHNWANQFHDRVSCMRPIFRRLGYILSRYSAVTNRIKYSVADGVAYLLSMPFQFLLGFISYYRCD